MRGQAIAALGASAMAMLAVGSPISSPAETGGLPEIPTSGEFGFVVETFMPPVVQSNDACPSGFSPSVREAFLESVTPDERQRLLLKQNEPELDKLWKASVFNAKGENICSQPDAFDRPLMPTVQSKEAEGLDLDGGSPGGVCQHEEFVTPQGATGIDNQEYRVMGCVKEWRGVDGIGGDQEKGYRQFLASGEWTQVILVRGVDSLERDDDVEVVYGNTPDRPMADSKGKFLRGASFTISEQAPRNRNVLKGKIVNGVLTTEPQDIKLTQTWGQAGSRDLRGKRSKWDFRRGRLRLVFQADGSIAGLVGGYKPVFDTIISPALGGAGAAIGAGIDCAARLKTLRHYADGLPDANGKCTAVSTAMRIVAVPAYVNDAPTAKVASR